MTEHFDFDRPSGAPFELVPVPDAETHILPETYRSKVFIHTVHDGDIIPREFREDEQGRPIVPLDVLDRAHVRERDWGANLVAKQIAIALGLPHYGRVRIARALLDFNRFPGSTPPSCRDPLDRLAINSPFAEALSHSQKMEVLNLYDGISDGVEAHFSDRLIVLGVHTYDELNPTNTSRPQLSLVNIPAGYQREAKMPYGVFDPIYPDLLGESTCNRILRDRVSLNLERTGFRVMSNHPYALPEGSVEVRAQVWYFFTYVRQRFEQERPQTAGDEAYSLVWRMLLNTNLRDALPEALRGHLHRLRRAGVEHETLFRQAEVAYRTIRDYLADGRVRDDYRRAPNRPSSLALEIRKDLLCDIDPKHGTPRPAKAEAKKRAQLIAKVVAGAIATYLETDRVAREDVPGELTEDAL
ncbi:MAG: hypothetical protein AAF799_40160 [Myxococcota bacterium]